MDINETINGVPLTEEQIAAWVREVEAGYDVEELKTRGTGRPGPSAELSRADVLRQKSNSTGSSAE